METTVELMRAAEEVVPPVAEEALVQAVLFGLTLLLSRLAL